MKKLLIGLLTIAMCTGVSNAQESTGPKNSTTNYDPDGTYWGEPVHAIHVDFTNWNTSDLAKNDQLQEKDNIGFYKFEIGERSFPPKWEKLISLYNANPTYEQGKNQTDPAMIYFPTMKDGAGTLRICGYVSNDLERPIMLNIFKEANEGEEGGSETWEYMGGILLPNKSGEKTEVQAEINVEGKVRVGLFYKEAAYPSIKSISISAFGEHLPTGTLPSSSQETVFLLGNLVNLPSMSDIYFYTLSGELIYQKKGCIGLETLPKETGIVTVHSNGIFKSFKKVF